MHTLWLLHTAKSMTPATCSVGRGNILSSQLIGLEAPVGDRTSGGKAVTKPKQKTILYHFKILFISLHITQVYSHILLNINNPVSIK